MPAGSRGQLGACRSRCVRACHPCGSASCCSLRPPHRHGASNFALLVCLPCDQRSGNAVLCIPNHLPTAVNQWLRPPLVRLAGPEAAASHSMADAAPADGAAEAASEEVPAPESAAPAGRATRRRKGAKAAAPAAAIEESPAEAAGLAAVVEQAAVNPVEVRICAAWIVVVYLPVCLHSVNGQTSGAGWCAVVPSCDMISACLYAQHLETGWVMLPRNVRCRRCQGRVEHLYH